jgi:tetratricopeptide (TPR) repeat protein
MLALASAICVFCLVTMGCEKDATELSKEGSIHLLQKNYPQAISAFEAALTLAPGNFEAMVGLAEAYTEQGEHAKAHEYFEKVYAASPDKGRQLYVDSKFQALLLAEADAMEDKSSDAYEAALRKVVDKRKRGEAADQAYERLAAFYTSRGDELAKDAKTRVQAAEYYEMLRTVKTTRELRKQSLDKAEALFRAAYKDEFAQRLVAEKASWAEESTLSEKDGRLLVTSAIEDRKLRFKTDEDKAPYQRKLTQDAQMQMILAMHRLSDTKPPTPLRNYKLATLKVDSEIYGRGKASVVVSVGLEELEEVSYEKLVKPARKAARKAANKAAKEAVPTESRLPWVRARKAANKAAKEAAKKGPAAPADGAKPAADGAAKPADGAAEPGDGAAKPADGAAKPADGAAKPADGAAKPADGAAKPAADGDAKPADGTSAKPSDGAAKPAAGAK